MKMDENGEISILFMNQFSICCIESNVMVLSDTLNLLQRTCNNSSWLGRIIPRCLEIYTSETTDFRFSQPVSSHL